MPTAIGAGRFSAVMVLVDPYDSDRVTDVTWSGFLAQSGLLAFLLRSGASVGRWSTSAAVWCRPGTVAGWPFEPASRYSQYPPSGVPRPLPL